MDHFITERNHSKAFIAKIIVDHLIALETQFCTYFILNIDFKKVAWIQKLFHIDLSEINLSLKAQ